jgi:nitrite reductase (NADH) large subunit
MRAVKPRRLVVVGNGMAAVRTLEELLRVAPGQFHISVLGAEAHGHYNRIGLTPVLAGEKSFADILTHDHDWYAAQGITLYAGDPAVAIDRQRREVHSRQGRILPYDRLLIATGSTPFVPAQPGHDLPGVLCFRDIEDVEHMLAAGRQGARRAVVVGGGLLGLEAACGLLHRGMQVSVVHVHAQLMERQLDPYAAALLQAALERRGLRFILPARTLAILGDRQARGLRLEDGRECAAELVVMATGVRPNIALAQQAGLYCERALVVDDTLQTLTDPRIYAVGECVQHRQTTYGLVAPLYEQARVCAQHLAGLGTGRYSGSQTGTRLKVTGIDLFSAGEHAGGPGTQDLYYRDPAQGVYKRLALRNGRITGVLLMGDVRDSAWYFDLLQRGVDVGPWRDRLLFGRARCEPLAQAA